MAIDTENKRRSALNSIFVGLNINPVPDGVIDAFDRVHVLGLYSGITISTAVFVSSGTGISPVIDAGGTVSWKSISNNTDGGETPSGASISFTIATSDNGSSFTSFGAIELAVNSRFAKIKVMLTGNTITTPTLNDVDLMLRVIASRIPMLQRTIKVIDVSESTTLVFFPESEIVVRCNTDTGPYTVDLPASAGVLNKTYNIKNVGTSGNDVTVDPSGAETIEGQATRLVKDGDNMRLLADAEDAWDII